MIRDARREDLAEIAALIRELAEYERLLDAVRWTEDELAAAVFGPDAVPKVVIAETDDGSVAGMALYFPTFSTFRGTPGIWLEDLYVRPPYRNAGYGRALLEELRTRTAHRIEWSVLDWNESAQGFYRRLGASPMGEWTTWRWLPAGEVDEPPADSPPADPPGE